MITRSQAKLAAGAADALPEQPFRFLDLPKELRLMVFDELMDNKKNDIKFTAPRNLEIDFLYLDGMYYPNLLQASKQVHDEYWPLCLRQSVLWIHYTHAGPTASNQQNSQELKVAIPLLSKWIKMPVKILVRIREVVFKFEAMWTLPAFGKLDSICVGCSRSTGF
jgi:hypothetical protein